MALTMQTSSHLLAAVRKREAMLLESVYSRSFCWNRASYLEGEQDVTVGGVQVGTLVTYRVDTLVTYRAPAAGASLSHTSLPPPSLSYCLRGPWPSNSSCSCTEAINPEG